MKALVIDDSKSLRTTLTALLNDLGYDVAEAADGREALTLLSQPGQKYALAMVDWIMPVMNGYDFVRAVRTRPELNGLRLIMCTTETELEQIERALLAGANEYIMKPFTKDILREKLELLGIAA